MATEESYDDTPVINTEKLSALFSFYKFPLILGTIGIVFLLSTLILLIKGKRDNSDIVFTQESSLSGKISVKIKVDIEGAVISPGVYQMEEGSRVADVLTAAGGLSADAGRTWVAKNLNRAAKLSDGAKIYIPTEKELNSRQSFPLTDLNGPPRQAGLSNIAGVTSKTVNINTASSVELEALPGVGPVTAGKIIAGRPYQSIEELKTKKIIGVSLFDKLKDSLAIY